MENTQLRSAKGYNVEKIIFSKIQTQKIGDTGMVAKRINIGTENDDGTTGELVFETGRLFSFGVNENIDQKSKEINGYMMPICLHSKDGPTEDEKAFTDTLDAIVEKCKDYLIDNKKELKMKDLERTDLRKLNPIFIKKNADGEVAEGASPTLYAKLIVSKKNGQNKIMTEFFDGVTGNPFRPLDLLGKYCYVKAVVKIESLFLGSLKTSLQIKLYEAEVNLINSGVKRLLSRPKANPQVQNLVDSIVSNPMLNDDSDIDNDEVSSLKDPDEEELKIEETIKELPKKKKIIVTKKKKAEE
jgi:hypothetical protein